MLTRMTITEGSTAYLSVSLKDKAGALAAPASLSYSLTCMTTGAVLRQDVPLAPASQVEITLTPADNAIQSQANLYEIRRVTVKAGYGAADALNEEYEYQVKNLTGVQ
jgi:hypothetical protein